MIHKIELSFGIIMIGVIILLVLTHTKHNPKPCEVYIWTEQNPFIKNEVYKDSVISVKDGFVLFNEYLNDTLIYTNASCSISEFFKESKELVKCQ